MNDTTIVVVSVICSLISAIGRSVGLYLSGKRDRQTRRIRTLGALHEFFKTAHAYKRTLADCKDNPDAFAAVRALLLTGYRRNEIVSPGPGSMDARVVSASK